MNLSWEALNERFEGDPWQLVFACLQWNSHLSGLALQDWNIISWLQGSMRLEALLGLPLVGRCLPFAGWDSLRAHGPVRVFSLGQPFGYIRFPLLYLSRRWIQFLLIAVFEFTSVTLLLPIWLCLLALLCFVFLLFLSYPVLEQFCCFYEMQWDGEESHQLLCPLSVSLHFI